MGWGAPGSAAPPCPLAQTCIPHAYLPGWTERPQGGGRRGKNCCAGRGESEQMETMRITGAQLLSIPDYLASTTVGSRNPFQGQPTATGGPGVLLLPSLLLSAGLPFLSREPFAGSCHLTSGGWQRTESGQRATARALAGHPKSLANT
jgi:hypothetical protein